jgi:hypothetical protein
MDAVRFGRALGFGARSAAKTLVTAVDAATSENPSSKGAKPAASQRAPASEARELAVAPATRMPTIERPTPSASRSTIRTKPKKRVGTRGLRQGTKRFGEAVWRPFVRLSGVLGLEVAGVFFGIFALFALGTVWHLRGDWHRTSAGHQQLIWGLVMLAVFGYFCVSSFVRARRRERGR